MKEVYHSSKEQGMIKLIPQESTHGKKWVYACKDMVMAAVFLNRYLGDFSCSVGRDKETGKPYICERFENAFDLRYNSKKGSIYVLPGDKFLENLTSWGEELISPEEIVPSNEIKVENVKEYLLDLEKNKKLIIKYFPEKIAGIPEDDSDLIRKAIKWDALNIIKEFHPHLLQRIVDKLK